MCLKVAKRINFKVLITTQNSYNYMKLRTLTKLVILISQYTRISDHVHLKLIHTILYGNYTSIKL